MDAAGEASHRVRLGHAQGDIAPRLLEFLEERPFFRLGHDTVYRRAEVQAGSGAKRKQVHEIGHGPPDFGVPRLDDGQDPELGEPECQRHQEEAESIGKGQRGHPRQARKHEPRGEELLDINGIPKAGGIQAAARPLPVSLPHHPPGYRNQEVQRGLHHREKVLLLEYTGLPGWPMDGQDQGTQEPHNRSPADGI